MRARYVFKKRSYENKWKQYRNDMSVSFRCNICDYMDCQVQASGQKYACIQVFPSSLGNKNAETVFFQWKWWHVHFILFVLQVPTSPKWGKEGELNLGKVRKKECLGPKWQRLTPGCDPWWSSCKPQRSTCRNHLRPPSGWGWIRQGGWKGWYPCSLSQVPRLWSQAAGNLSNMGGGKQP